MADQRLTDKTAKTTGIDLDFIMHIVDTTDTTDNAAGSSFKASLRNMLKGNAFIFILGCLVLKRTDTDGTIIAANDWVFYMSAVSDRLVIGVAAGTGVATVPDDFDDTAKFVKFYEGNSLLP